MPLQALCSLAGNCLQENKVLEGLHKHIVPQALCLKCFRHNINNCSILMRISQWAKCEFCIKKVPVRALFLATISLFHFLFSLPVLRLFFPLSFSVFFVPFASSGLSQRLVREFFLPLLCTAH